MADPQFPQLPECTPSGLEILYLADLALNGGQRQHSSSQSALRAPGSTRPSSLNEEKIFNMFDLIK